MRSGRRAPRISLSDTTPPAPEGYTNVKWQSDALGNRSGYVADGGSGSVSDAAYDSSWNGVTTVAPSKNAVYDKIESMGSSGGGGILAYMEYNPGSVATHSTTSATLAIIDSTNLKLPSFTAPASGKVIVRVTGLIDNGGGVYSWALIGSSSATQWGPVQSLLSASSNQVRITGQFIATGLTPSTTYSSSDPWCIAHAVDGGGTGRLFVGGTFNHRYQMTVEPLP